MGGAAFLLFNLPFVLGGLAHPETPFSFNTSLIPSVLTVLTVLGAIGTLASWQLSAHRPAIDVGVIALGAVVSLVASTAVDDATPEPGDLVVVTAGLRFVPPDITGSGEMTIYVDNTAPVRHTFTIDALDLEVELPGGTAQRFQVDAPPGTYAFRCAVPGHEEMTGSLVVTR